MGGFVVMVDEKATHNRGIKDVVKREFLGFMKSPLLYAIDRCITLCFLALTICILAFGIKMLVAAGKALVQ
jgi:hypothetical protein